MGKTSFMATHLIKASLFCWVPEHNRVTSWSGHFDPKWLSRSGQTLFIWKVAKHSCKTVHLNNNTVLFFFSIAR